jgi:hypothetical protein
MASAVFILFAGIPLGLVEFVLVDKLGSNVGLFLVIIIVLVTFERIFKIFMRNLSDFKNDTDLHRIYKSRFDCNNTSASSNGSFNIERYYSPDKPTRKFSVIRNGVPVAVVAQKESARVEIASGECLIQIRLDVYASKPLMINITSQETINLYCDFERRGWKKNFLLSIMLAPDRCLRLETSDWMSSSLSG